MLRQTEKHFIVSLLQESWFPNFTTKKITNFNLKLMWDLYPSPPDGDATLILLRLYVIQSQVADERGDPKRKGEFSSRRLDMPLVPVQGRFENSKCLATDCA
ncbi:hypothetical protein AVEN_45864-1 [Araneus ventricosus]|uniref:Uncharacterized protein n=1 Tax=Araneus ventricosus TaxID=182803 RepID=A0A4Y2MPT5_ARAVE|nr:hypothetical protein AVEN_45864-1 [Araneus ventricosus]